MPRNSLSGGFRAVLWHQGESDAIAQMTQAETYNNLRKLIIDLNRDLGFTAAGITVPWFVAKVAYYPISRAAQPHRWGRDRRHRRTVR